MKESSLMQEYFSISEETIHVYKISVAKNRHLLSFYHMYLSEDEKQRAIRFKFKIDQERFVVSRAVLRIISGVLIDTDPKQIQFSYTEYGKPSIQGISRLKFNVSHSGDLIVIGFAYDYEIGIDIELIKTDFEPLKLAKSFFSNSEIASLEKQPKKNLPKAFFRCWTRKESFIKAEGSGLSFPLDQFSVSIDSDFTAALLSTDWDILEQKKWNLHSFIPDTQYVGALSVRNKQFRAKYFDLDASNEILKLASK